MRRRGRALAFGGAFLAAAAMTLADVRLARPAAVVLTVARTDHRVPADPWDRIWERAAAVDVPLSAQTLTRPIGGRSGAVTARAMHDGERLYVLLRWRDQTRDASVGAPQSFADQAAIEFPTRRGDTVPFFCMGDPRATVNLWLWKASRQADVDRGYRDVSATYPRAVADLYPFEDDPAFYPGRAAGNLVSATSGGPVENIVAGGFGTATPAAAQGVGGRGLWRGEEWRVVFVRDLAPGDEEQVDLRAPQATSIAFAVWNGSAGERDGLKSVSQFVSLRLTEAPLGPAPGSMLPVLVWSLVGVVVAAGIVATPMALGRRRAARGAPDDGDDR